jgi:hypothetical protein
MSKKPLNEVYRFQELAGIRREEEELDSPETLESKMKSALIKAGVDFSKPIFVVTFSRGGDFIHTLKHDDIQRYINYITSSIKMYRGTVDDLKISKPNKSIFFKRMKDVPAGARAKLTMYLGKSLSRFNTIWQEAGIKKEMRVGPGGLMSDEEAVKQAIDGHTHSLAKIIKALNRDPQYTRARQALDMWIKSVSEKLNIDPDSVPKHHQAFSGEYSYGKALPMIKQIFVDLISGGDDEGELAEEDDYDMGTPSGDTDAMNIAEDDFSGTMDAVDKDPVV